MTPNEFRSVIEACAKVCKERYELRLCEDRVNAYGLSDEYLDGYHDACIDCDNRIRALRPEDCGVNEWSGGKPLDESAFPAPCGSPLECGGNDPFCRWRDPPASQSVDQAGQPSTTAPSQEAPAAGLGSMDPRPTLTPLSETARSMRMPESPEVLVSAMQDKIHIDTGRTRSAIAIRRPPQDEMPPMPHPLPEH